MFAKLKTAWRAFNHWRRSAFSFRLTVLLLLLVFGTGLLERAITENHSPLINELVWIACKAIRYSSEPRIPSAYLRYYRARENQRLQNELRDRIAGGLQLSQDELAAVNAKPSKFDNKILFVIAKRHGILSAGVSQREYMRSMWAASLSMTAMEFDKDWDDVRNQIFNTVNFIEWPRNWGVGVGRFYYLITEILPIPLVVTVPWFILCLTLAFIAVKNPSSIWQRTLAIALPILLTLAWTSRNIVKKSQLPPLPYWDYCGISYIAYFSILAVIAGILGIRLRRWTAEKGNMDKFFPELLFIAGTLLMFQFFYKPEKNLAYNWYERYSGDIFCNIPFWGILLLCLTGAGMTIYAIRAFFRLQSAGRIQRFRISPNLLCYLFWGITVMWTLYLLSLPGSSGVVDVVIIACLKITVCIGSILCGLSLSGPYTKELS